MRVWVAILFLVGVLSAAAAARADERGVAKEHYIKGTKAFDLGYYDDAIHEYELAYQAKDDPALLYNLAQAHRLAGHAQEALRFYRIYLTKLPKAQNAGDVEVKIAELQKAIEQQHKTQTALPPDQVLRPNQPEGAPQAVSAPPVAAEREIAPAPAPAPRTAIAPEPRVEPWMPSPRARTMKLAGIGAASAGLAFVIVGAGLGAAAQNAADDLVRSATFDQSKLDAFHLFRGLEGAFLGLGLAAVVSGVVVYAVGWHQSRSPRLSPRAAGSASVVATW